jgi:hypothetical protein
VLGVNKIKLGPLHSREGGGSVQKEDGAVSSQFKTKFKNNND